MGRPRRRRIFRQYQPHHRQAGLPDRPLAGRRYRACLDAAHKAKEAWGNTAPAKRAEILNKIADRMQENLQVLAAVETIDNGKPIRETSFADIPLAIDHFRYFAACVRAQRLAVGDRS
jgi:acyl-CoA reductase-like NAD-dependent aldehyde dehydrogenase